MDNIIAAIELSSSKIYGVVGKKEDSTIKVIAQAIEPSSDFIRKGVVLNLDKTARAIQSVIASLNSRLDEDEVITRVYVGISGQSLHTKKNIVRRYLDEETIISQKMVDDIAEQNRSTPITGDLEILEVEPQEYKIGSNTEAEPIGISAKEVEARFVNILARTSVQKKLQNSFELANVSIAELFIAPMKTAKAVLTDAEMRSGCALVEFGADTTTVSIYKGNMLRFLSVIPLGGNNITHDITCLQMEEEEAEQLKLMCGNAMYEEDAEEGKTTVIQLEDGSRTIELKRLNDIVAARAEEIVANVCNQIKLSGYKDDIYAGLVTTGGGGNLRNLNKLLNQKSEANKLRFAKTVRSEVKTEGTVVLEKDGSENTILGLLIAGNENCVTKKEPEVIVEPPVQQPVEQPPVEEKPTPGKLFDDDELIVEQPVEKKQKPKAKKGWNILKRTIDKITDVSDDLFKDSDSAM